MVNMNTPIEFKKNTHCSYCGSPHVEQVIWPRKCINCQNESYINPIPVVVTIIPIMRDGEVGMIIQQRGIQPKKGEWALSSGYMNDGETWQEAIAREVFEELGVITSPADYKLLDVESSTNKSQVLIFSFYRKGFASIQDIPFVPNYEVQAIRAIYEPEELAFSSHTDIVKRYFNKD